MAFKTLLSLFLGSSMTAPAVLLAHYDFTDGDLTDNEVGASETLTLVTNGATGLSITPMGAAMFPG